MVDDFFDKSSLDFHIEASCYSSRVLIKAGVMPLPVAAYLRRHLVKQKNRQPDASASARTGVLRRRRQEPRAEKVADLKPLSEQQSTNLFQHDSLPASFGSICRSHETSCTDTWE